MKLTKYHISIIRKKSIDFYSFLFKFTLLNLAYNFSCLVGFYYGKFLTSLKILPSKTMLGQD